MEAKGEGGSLQKTRPKTQPSVNDQAADSRQQAFLTRHKIEGPIDASAIEAIAEKDNHGDADERPQQRCRISDTQRCLLTMSR